MQPSTMATDLKRVERVAQALDQKWLDPIVGFVLPGAGDIVSAVFGLYLVRLSLRHQLPKVVIARMLLNLALDMAVGAVPLLGDVFDFGFKANDRNAKLFVARANEIAKVGHADQKQHLRDWAIVTGAAMVALAALAIPIYLIIRLVQYIV